MSLPVVPIEQYLGNDKVASACDDPLLCLYGAVVRYAIGDALSGNSRSAEALDWLASQEPTVLEIARRRFPQLRN